MVKKWIKAIFTKPFRILKSIYYNVFNKHQDLASHRLSICKKCDKRLNTYLGDICTDCGCILENKTRLEEEHCDLCKW